MFTLLKDVSSEYGYYYIIIQIHRLEAHPKYPKEKFMSSQKAPETMEILIFINACTFVRAAVLAKSESSSHV